MYESITWNHVIAHIFNVFNTSTGKNTYLALEVSEQKNERERECVCVCLCMDVGDIEIILFPRAIAHSHIHESACIDQVLKSIVVAHNLQINEKLILVYILVPATRFHFFCPYAMMHSFC